MHNGPVENVLLIHGYSVRTLNSWGKLPALLLADGFKASAVYLSAFVSLDDEISCDDLAVALEHRIAALEKNGLDLGKTAMITHSTGAIIARRWLLNRRARGGATLSHFISGAGANHGSSLSQLGRTELAYAYRALAEKSDVGKQVLADLDYGSEFLRRLNRDWLTEWNAGNPLHDDTFCFSLGGTDHSFWQNQLSWQAHELGSDGTVRVGGANLNYRFINLRPPYDKFDANNIEIMKVACPHLVIETPEDPVKKISKKLYSHTSQASKDTFGLVMSGAAGAIDQFVHGGRAPEPVTSKVFGIFEGIESVYERPYQALREAFALQDPTKYPNLSADWAAETARWSQENPEQTNSTVVVSICDQWGRPTQDSLVLLRDPGTTIQSTSQSILTHQPIRNEVCPSVVSLYVNYGLFSAAHPHGIHLEARTNTPYVSDHFVVDGPLSGDTADGDQVHVVAANEFTYVDVKVERDPSPAFVFYSSAMPNLAQILDKPYPPFEPGFTP